MSDKPVHITAALGIGAIIGFPIGAFVAANILHFPIGEGWGSVIGALLGVCGAFLVANFSFNRNLKARDHERRQPVVKRYEYFLESLQAATRQGVEIEILPSRFYLGGIREDKIMAFDMECWIDDALRYWTIRKISEELTHIREELTWLLETKGDVISPKEGRELKGAVKCTEDAISAINIPGNANEPGWKIQDHKFNVGQIWLAMSLEDAYFCIQEAKSLT